MVALFYIDKPQVPDHLTRDSGSSRMSPYQLKVYTLGIVSDGNILVFLSLEIDGSSSISSNSPEKG